MILGVDLGGFPDPMIFGHFGEVMNVRQRAEMLDVALNIIAGLLNGQWFSYHGRHF
jgi:hypothetical protein